MTLRKAFHFEAYEGLRTADNLRQKYLLVPAKVKEVYLAYLLQPEQLAARKVRSVLVFCGTVRSCQARQPAQEEPPRPKPRPRLWARPTDLVRVSSPARVLCACCAAPGGHAAGAGHRLGGAAQRQAAEIPPGAPSYAL